MMPSAAPIKSTMMSSPIKAAVMVTAAGVVVMVMTVVRVMVVVGIRVACIAEHAGPKPSVG
jgi:hypothetical protein